MKKGRAIRGVIAGAIAIGASALLLSKLLPAAEAVADVPERPITTEERDHWSYQPIASVEPPSVADPRFAGHPVDQFVKAALVAKDVEALPRAGRATLLRRLYFDLTGRPPSAEEARRWLADTAPDAYDRLVERLLASPAYGERWAQHWLDLARFAETDGFEHDTIRPNAWRYRDWVIDALAADMPFDEFVKLQLAGDELLPGDARAAVATGFLLCGPDMPDINNQDERRHQVLNEMASTVGSVFLGMQFGCAQCHDHKYDPIRQHDFYRLRAFFEASDIFREHPVPTAEELAVRQAAEDARDPEERRRADRLQELAELGQNRFREKNPDIKPSAKLMLAELSDEERDEHATLTKQLRKAKPLPALSMGRVVRQGKPREAHLFLRGDFRTPGPVVESGLPRVLVPQPTNEQGQQGCNTASAQSPGSRAQLAGWLTSADHPLTARVIVNRLWQWHFGAALAGNASDFGVMGREPTHPELLDWLARRFVADGWSFKKMHRLLVTSETYKAASGPFDAEWSDEQRKAATDVFARSQARDPDNELLWRRRRMRLDGESIRDAMLAASGKLSQRRGGAGIRPPLSPEVADTLLKDQWQVTGDEEDHRRASIYLFVRRNLRYPLFDVFDRPDTNASCAARHQSTTATQSLMLLNSEFSLSAARWLAGAVTSAHAADRKLQIEEAYARAFSRAATAEEIRAGETFLDQQAERLRGEGRDPGSLATPDAAGIAIDPFAGAALVDFCLALFSANEFVYLD